MREDYFEWEKVHSIPISALQHYIYCPRQFALIHIEEIYEENIFTIDGNFVHERVDNANNYYNKQINCENSLPIWSDKLGLYGVADVVEFYKGIPFPVEFKRGKKKNKLADDVQLMAQGYCLEEMFDLTIEKGAVYYNKSRRRREVLFTKELRHRLEKTVKNVRKLMINKKVPAPVNDLRCNNCSLKEICLPNLNERVKKVNEKFFKEINYGSKS